MKRIFLVLGALLLTVIVFVSIDWYRQERATQSAIELRRQYILCERLQKNMSMDEVVIILNEYGNFKYGESSSGGRSSEIFGNFDDFTIIGESTVHIVFLDGKYDNSYIKVFDQGELLCLHNN